MNRDNINTNIAFNQKLYYDDYSIINNIFSSNDFNIDKSKYGNYFSRKCILGFPSMNNLPYSSGYFKYDIDSLTGRIINKF
jgi:hypothetical protein